MHYILLGELNPIVNPFQNIANTSSEKIIAARVGISLESLIDLSGQTPAVENTSNSTKLGDNIEFALFAAENLFNFAASCAQEVTGTSEAYVPLSAVKRWLETIQRKLSFDSNFWKK